jgi:hypothetical protein
MLSILLPHLGCRPMGVTPQIPGILRASSGVGAFCRLFVLPRAFFTLCLNVKRGLTGRGVHLLVAWLLVLANVSGTLTDAIANPSANSALFMLMASYFL